MQGLMDHVGGIGRVRWRRYAVMQIDLIALLLCCMAGAVGAVPVVVDFNRTGGLLNTDYIENGFRFSPNCHYDFEPGGGYGGSPYIAIDRSACGGGGLYNAAFRGPGAYQLTPSTPFFSVPAVLFIESLGGAFSLEEFYSPYAPWRLESSNGGRYTGPFPAAIRQTIAFGGAEWQNLQWLLFVAISDPGAPVIGLDHLRFDVPVPEPSSLSLLALGLAGLAGLAAARRRTQ